MSLAVKLTSCFVRASPAEPKPFSKSSMKSAPLARQREANEANGSISDTLIPRDYGELYNLNPRSSPSSPLLAGAVSELTRLFPRVTLNFKLLVPIFPNLCFYIWLYLHVVQVLFIYAPPIFLPQSSNDTVCINMQQSCI